MVYLLQYLYNYNDFANLGKSVADGKSSVANAISNKGVATASDASFSILTENIGKIITGGTPTLISSGGAMGCGCHMYIHGEYNGNYAYTYGGWNISSSYDEATRQLTISGTAATSAGFNVEYIYLVPNGSANFSVTIQL